MPGTYYVNMKVEAAAVGDISDHHYYDWRGTQDIAEYCGRVPSGEFTVQTYCAEALMDRHGSLQLIRWERERIHPRLGSRCCPPGVNLVPAELPEGKISIGSPTRGTPYMSAPSSRTEGSLGHTVCWISL